MYSLKPKPKKGGPLAFMRQPKIWAYPLGIWLFLLVFLGFQLFWSSSADEIEVAIDATHDVQVEETANAEADTTSDPSAQLLQGELAVAGSLGDSSADATMDATADEAEDLTQFSVEPAIVKQYVNPKRFLIASQTADPAEETAYLLETDKKNWRFAPVLGDSQNSAIWKPIVIQHGMIINLSVAEQYKGLWKILIEDHKRMIFQQIDDTTLNLSFDRTRKKKYALQLISLPSDQFEQGVDLVKTLVMGGYYAYLKRTEVTNDRGGRDRSANRYQVRVGFFETESAAATAGWEIAETYQDRVNIPSQFWTVLPTYQELSGEVLDFGVLRNTPWMLEFPTFKDRTKAFEALRDVVPRAEISYLAQRKGKKGLEYRLRTGFYESQTTASQALAKLSANNPKLLAKAKAVSVRFSFSVPDVLSTETVDGMGEE